MIPEKSIVMAIKKLHNEFQRYISAMQAELVIRYPFIEHPTELHGRIIHYLFDHPKEDVFQKDLEKEFNIRRSTATIILQKMERAGMIQRHINAVDARMKTITVTDKARKIHPQILKTIREAEMKFTDGLTEHEIETFLRLTKKIRENIEKTLG